MPPALFRLIISALSYFKTTSMVLSEKMLASKLLNFLLINPFSVVWAWHVSTHANAHVPDIHSAGSKPKPYRA